MFCAAWHQNYYIVTVDVFLRIDSGDVNRTYHWQILAEINGCPVSKWSVTN